MSGRIVADQTLRRLTSGMRDNFALRGDLVDSLSGLSGQDISAQVAGYAMKPLLPHGILGSGAGIAGVSIGGSAATVAGWLKPEMWTILAAASPRLSGEFLYHYGKILAQTSGVSEAVGNTLGIEMTKFIDSLRNKKEEEPQQ